MQLFFKEKKTDDSKIHKKNHKKFRVEKQQTVAVEIQKKIIILILSVPTQIFYYKLAPLNFA